jgi:hypothetical protein
VSGQEVALSRTKAAQRIGGGGSGESRDRTREIMAWLVYLSVGVNLENDRHHICTRQAAFTAELS